MIDSIHKTVTREQALEVERNHFKHCQELQEQEKMMDNIDFIKNHIKGYYNISSVKEFII